MTTIDRILAKAADGTRLTPEEGVELFRCRDLHKLGRAAHAMRIQRAPHHVARVRRERRRVQARTDPGGRRQGDQRQKHAGDHTPTVSWRPCRSALRCGSESPSALPPASRPECAAQRPPAPAANWDSAPPVPAAPPTGWETETGQAQSGSDRGAPSRHHPSGSPPRSSAGRGTAGSSSGTPLPR